MEIENKDMTPILIEDLGMRFPTEKSKQRVRYGLYQCQYCEKEFEAGISHVKSGHTKSCGCFKIAKISTLNVIHALSKHPLYYTWVNMKARCNNLNDKRYKEYGGRGIQVCERWLDINKFIEDMYPSWEEGLSLDRIDVNGNYEPDNCRFTTPLIQSQNIRPIKKANRSGYKGVSWNKQHNKYEVRIRYLGKKLHLGLFEDPLAGAKAYQRFVLENNTEHSYVPVLTEEEIEEINKKKE